MTNNANEEIIYAPIEIESADQLHALGATWEDCRTWRIGVTPVKVYLVPADQETRDYLISDLRKKYANRSRQTRCQVPGKYNRPISCPECNHCDRCPYGFSAAERESKVISLDCLLEDGYEEGGNDTTADQAENRVELMVLLEKLREEDPTYLDVVILKASGYTRDEMSDRLKIPRTTVHRMLHRIREIGEQYR